MASLQPLAFFGQKAADTHSFFGEDSLYSLKAVRKFLSIFKSFSLIIFVETILLQHWHSLHNLLSYLGPLELLGLHWGQNGNWFIHFWPSVEAVLNLTKRFFYQKDTKINVTNATKIFNSLHLNTEAPEAKHQACTNGFTCCFSWRLASPASRHHPELSKP